MQVVFGVITTVLTVVFVFLLAGLARRILGAPVGWFRAIVFGIASIGFDSSLLGYVAVRSGLIVDGRLAVDPLVGMLIATLAVAWMFVLGLAALVILEMLLPTGSVPNPIELLGRWRRQRRRARRYTVIISIAARHGLGRFVRAGARFGRTNGQAGPSTAVALRKALEGAGVAFVKLGQMLSTRRDLLSAAFIDELSKLQAQAQPAPWSDIEPAIAAALGRPIDEVFSTVEPEPLAAASVGQVHRARLRDGREVVLKVQRPAARRQITADLDIILQLSRRLDRVTQWGRSIGILGLAEGFAESLREELDYTVELDNTRAVAAALTGDERITVPQTFADLSTPTVLVMERLDGTPLTAAADLLSGFTTEQRHELAAMVLGSVLHQIVVTGIFHADLHPGNLLIRPDRTVGLLDFGSVGRLDRPARTALGLLLFAIDHDDPLAATGALIELLGRPDDVDQRALERSIGELMVRFRGGLGTQGTMGVFTALFKLILAHRFAVPAQVAAAFRAMAAVEGTVTLLSPGADLLGMAREQAGELMKAATRPAEIRQTLETQLATLLPIVQRLPHRINKITEDLEQGRFTIQVRALADRRDRAFVTGLVQQVMLTILAATASISSILLLTSDAGPLLTPTVRLYPLLGYAFLFIGFVLGLRVLVRIFFRGSTE
jgi:ubiquinone biosynthesis protein